MTELLVIAGIVGAIWSTVLFLRGSLMGGLLAVLVTGTCFGPYFFSLEGGPIPITLDRVLLAVLVAQYTIARWGPWQLADPKPLGKPEWVLLALVAVVAFSTFSHDWHAERNQPVRQLVFLQLMPLTMYWIARQSIVTERRVMWLFGTLAVLGLYLGFTSVAESQRQFWAVFPKYITLATHSSFLGRGRGPLLNPAGNGIFLVAGLGALLMAWPRLPVRARPWIALGSLVILAGVYSTLTRCAWMGAGLMLFIAAAAVLPKTWRGPVLGGMLVMSILGGVVFWDSILSFKRDTELSEKEVEESAKLRPLLAVIAWNMFLDRPLMGCGYAQYMAVEVEYLSDRSIDLPLEKARIYVQHNVFLSMLTEIGLVGMLLFIILLGLWSLDAVRLWGNHDAPLWMRQMGLLFLFTLGGYLPNGMFQDVGMIPMVHMLVFLVAGVMRSVVALAPQPAATNRPVTHMLPTPDPADSAWHIEAYLSFLPKSRILNPNSQSHPMSTALDTRPLDRHAVAAISGRLALLDVARLAAALAIIWIHAPRSAALVPTTILARFAVPFFAAGAVLFVFDTLARHAGRSWLAYARSRVMRLYAPFLAWSVIYLAFKAVKSLVAPEQENDFPGFEFFWVGGAYHLWFMPFILVASVAVYALGQSIARHPSQVSIVAILGIAAGLFIAIVPMPSKDVTLRLAWNALPAVCWGIPLGLWWQSSDRAAMRDPRVTLSALGFFGLTMIALAVVGSSSLLENLAGTALLIAALGTYASPRIERLGHFGPLGYGIYLSHLLVIKVIESIAAKIGLEPTPMLDVLTFLAAAAGSIAIAWTLSRHPRTRWLAA